MKKGFTLSEVLITLGIIGIVAVLTIPAVMKNYRNRLYVAQLKKVYAQLSDAIQAEMNDENTGSFFETKASALNSCTNASKGECQAGPGYFLNTYFKPVKRNCKTGRYKCLANSYKTISGESANAFFGTYCIQIASGATICSVCNPANSITSIAVDVNGPAEPNITGRDVFTFEIKENGTIIDYGRGSCTCNQDCKQKHIADYSAGCLTAIKDAGWKMEY